MRIDYSWKLCVWGHKKETYHTNSYVQDSILKAARHLGMETHWLADGDEVNFDLPKTLFFAIEGNDHLNEMPVRDDCFYVLHNVYASHLAPLMEKNLRLNLQVYTDDCLQWAAQDIGPLVRFYPEAKIIFIPWATNLLPHEIEQYKELPENRSVVTWVGTMGAGIHGNVNELTPFRNAAKAAGYRFQHFASISDEEHIAHIRESIVAPAIVGTWQREKGYIPCRIFKNISYGQMGATNSPRVNALFNNKLVYNQNTHQLFYDIINKTNERDRLDLMDRVRDHHTYINWLNHVITCANEIGRGA